MGGKVISNMTASLIFRWSTPGSTQLGFLIAQASEFAFVILSPPTIRTLLGAKTTSILISSVTLTLAATPTVDEIGRRLAGALRAKAAKAADPELVPVEMAAPVLIFGIGPRGRSWPTPSSNSASVTWPSNPTNSVFAKGSPTATR
jgi:CPA2 family monovalent cation:H+ antiporter-2